MKKKFIAVILILTLLCSSAFMLASAKNIMLGDVNGDGNITASDARLALRASARLENLSKEAQTAADVNFDNNIAASDARKILRAAAKIEDLPEMPTTTTKPTTTKPSTTKPSATKPTTTKPSITKPTTTKPTTTKPSITKPSTTKPTTTKPATQPTTQPTTAPTTKPTTQPSTNPTTQPTTKPNNVERKYPAAIDTFLSGNYYLESITESDGTTSEMKIAMSEKGYEISASAEFVEGSPAMELGFMQLGETLYIKYPNALGIKKFFIVDEEIKTAMGFDSEEMFGSAFEYLDFSSIKIDKDPVKTKGDYNGKACDIYTFNTENGKIKFYAIGEEVKRINILDNAGKELAIIDVVQLSSSIPSNMLSTKGYREANMLEFVADLMVLMPDESA